MKKLRLSFLLIISFYSQSFGQFSYFEILNNTDQYITIYLTVYDLDSIKSSGVTSVGPNSRLAEARAQNYLRIDLIVLDQISQDTISKITALQNEIEIGAIVINEDVNSLLLDFPSKKRLGIRGSLFHSGLEIGNHVNFKLKTNKKIAGEIIQYCTDSIVLLNDKNKKIVVKPKEIKAIKYCSSLLSIGMRRSFFNHCKYIKTKNIKFQILEQRFNKKRLFWQWVEVK